MTDTDTTITETARRHGLSENAVRALIEALAAGGGGAQFNHPDLGGMGQWSGGMVQIGDMFNHGLKAKVAAACADLAAREPGEFRAGPPRGSVPSAGLPVKPDRSASWWPSALGQPSSTGAQNAARYAYFPEKRRLVVDRDGTVTVYDTGHHIIGGFAQRQGSASTMTFESRTGPVALESLKRIDS